MITLDSSNPPLGIWYVALPDRQSDFMGCLGPHPDEGGVFVFDCRFRYYHDDKVFDSSDDKHWYHLRLQESSPEDAIHKIRSVVLKLAEVFPRDGAQPPEVDELLYRNYEDFHAFLEAFQSKPWAFSKMVNESRSASKEANELQK